MFSFTIPSNQPPIVDAVDVATDGLSLYVLLGGEVRQLIKVDELGRLRWAVGGKGSGNGQFESPQGVAVGPGGVVYVVDRQNNRVQYFSASGAFLGEFGSMCFLAGDASFHTCVDPDGSGPLELGDGQFFQPTDIAADAAGRIYVADFNNHRIQVFSAPGVLAFKFGSTCVLDPSSTEAGLGCLDPDGAGPLATGDGQFYFPAGVAVDPSGRIAVADSRNHRVQVFDSAGLLLFKLGASGGDGSKGSGDGEFQTPEGVAFDPSGRIIVGAGPIQVFSASGEFENRVGRFCTTACGIGQINAFPRPGLAVDAGGNLLVADSERRYLQVFALDGTFIETIGNYGAATGLFNGVSGVAVGPADGRIYVSDLVNRRVQVFSASGAFVTAIATQDANRPGAIAVDQAGQLYVTMSSNNVVYVLSPTGQRLLQLGTPAHCVPSGFVVCPDPDDGQFLSPEGLAVGQDGRIYVADSGHHRVQVFDSGGHLLFKIGRNGGNGSLGTGDGAFFNPRGVAVDAGGRIYVADSRNHRVQVFSASGQFLFKFGRNSGNATKGSGPGEFDQVEDVAVDDSGRIYVVDSSSLAWEQDNHRIQVFGAAGQFLYQFGGYGLANGQFRFPGAVAVGANGKVAVADTGNNRVQVFSDPAADLALSMSGPATAAPGSTFSYVINVRNHGPAEAIDVILKDSLPSGASFLAGEVKTFFCTVENGVTSCGGTVSYEACSENAGVVACYLGDLIDTASGTVTLTVRLTAGVLGGLTNEASIASRAADPDPSNNSDVVITHVLDTTPPRLTLPSNLTAEATSAAGAGVTFVTSAQDDVDGALVATCTPGSGAIFPVGHTTVDCTATDAAGNSASEQFGVSVVDTTPPVVNAPNALVVEATAAGGATVLYAAVTASDIVDGTLTASCTPAPGAIFSLGSTTVVCSATDGAGNSSSGSFGVVVVDTTAPQLAAAPDRDVEATGPLTPVALDTPTVSDLVDPHPVVTSSTNGPFSVGTHSVVWKAVDASGNAALATQTVTVRDTTPPAISAPPDVSVEATGPLTMVALGTPSVSDLVDPQPTATPSATGPFGVGTQSIIWTAVDALGNAATATQTVTVHDTSPPVVTPPPDVLAMVTGPLTAVPLGAAIAMDLVDGVLAPGPSDLGPFAPGTHVITWSTTDSHGNVGTAFQTIVLRYAFGGLAAPIQVLPATNSAAAGATVPVKWSISDGSGGFIRDLTVVAALRFSETACDASTVENSVPTETAGSSGLRYDEATEQFVYNWRTNRSQSGRCYMFILELTDGTQQLARFMLR
jgi:uncharacterized repeat protein (TIGR01451 family)